MTIQPTTITDISDLIINELQTKFNKTLAFLPKAFNRVLAKVLGGVFVVLYKYGGFIFLQMFVETASNEWTEINGKEVKPLTEYGNLVGIGPPTAAVQAEYDMIFYPILPTGASTLKSGTPVLCDINGVTYVTVGDKSYGGGGAPSSETVTVRAASDQNGGNGAGTIGNVPDGAIAAFVAPPANINRNVLLDVATVIATDEEGIDSYRARILARFQTPPQGGAYADYALWSETVSQVANAYPYTGDPGQVDVYIEVNTSVDADGIPPAYVLTNVTNAIEQDLGGLATRRPANAYVNVLAITRTPFVVTVIGLIVDNVTEAQTSITAALQAWFLDREPYIPGWSVGTRKDQIFEAGVAGVVNDVVTSLGGLFTGVTMTEGGVPFSIRILEEGEKAKATVSYS